MSLLFLMMIYEISRCRKITGSLGKSIEEVFGKTIMDKYVSNSKFVPPDKTIFQRL
jgi:hypothetical protein